MQEFGYPAIPCNAPRAHQSVPYAAVSSVNLAIRQDFGADIGPLPQIKSAHCAAERGRISVCESSDSRVPHKGRDLIAPSDLRRTSMLYAIDVTDPYCPIPLDTMASEPLEYYQDPDTGNIMADKV